MKLDFKFKIKKSVALLSIFFMGTCGSVLAIDSNHAQPSYRFVTMPKSAELSHDKNGWNITITNPHGYFSYLTSGRGGDVDFPKFMKILGNKVSDANSTLTCSLGYKRINHYAMTLTDPLFNAKEQSISFRVVPFPSNQKKFDALLKTNGMKQDFQAKFEYPKCRGIVFVVAT